jgi:glyoxylase-like metal-dependent hydrolase (beta-lactamase superfamily II)/rhodanese-related sulfurtransferase
MKIEQIYTGCLAQGAYFIESEGQVAIIDPLRETDPYIEMAKKNNAEIKFILETHFHADFVSGHVDLANKTGATIVFGPNAVTEYDIHSAVDGEVLKLGKLTIKVLHTPGHTLESTCYLLSDENGKDIAIFTGDTLFIGDVGRPDLAVKSNITMEDLAGMLYESLHNKILPLADDVIVYPAHGAGSACGKNLSSETFATLGNQKQFNYALQAMSKDEFISKVTEGLATPPQYFPENVMMNKKGYSSIDDVLTQGLKALSPAEFEVEKSKGTLVLDVRDAQSFAKGFVPGSLNIGLRGSFAPWVGALVTNIRRPILLVVSEGDEREAVIRLARVGYDNVVGFLKGGVENWKNEGKTIEVISSISAAELENISNADSHIQILDVRNVGEFLSEHLQNAQNYPLGDLTSLMDSLDTNSTYYIHCAGGYRSMVAASLLRANGFKNLIDIAGGYKAIKETNLEKTDYICPSKINV